jgi:hypothetical protein
MIPTSFDYVRAESLKDALKALDGENGVKVIAGGHSLLPIMKFRLAQPTRLVDIVFFDSHESAMQNSALPAKLLSSPSHGGRRTTCSACWRIALVEMVWCCSMARTMMKSPARSMPIGSIAIKTPIA